MLLKKPQAAAPEEDEFKVSTGRKQSKAPKKEVAEPVSKKTYTPRAQKVDLRDSEFETVVAKKDKIVSARGAAADWSEDEEDLRTPNLLMVGLEPE